MTARQLSLLANDVVHRLKVVWHLHVVITDHSHVIEVVQANEPVGAAYRKIVGERHQSRHSAHGERDDR